MSDDNDWTLVESKTEKKKRIKKDMTAPVGRNFEGNRPNDTKEFLKDEDSSDNENEEDNEEDIVLESPLIWHRFGLIGNANFYIKSVLVKHGIFPSSESGKLSDLGNRIINDKWRWNNEVECDTSLRSISKRCQKLFKFISIIPQFTEREYGDENDVPIYFIHIRFDYYFLAEKKPRINYSIDMLDYYGFLGDKPTHVPTSDAMNVDDDRLNFMRIMRIVEGKMTHDKFQEKLDENPSDPNKRLYYTAPLNEDLSTNKAFIFRCKLFLEDSFSGYGTILDEQNLERKIYLHNRKNCYQAFNEDIVNILVFQSSNTTKNKLPERQTWSGKVISVERSDVKPVNKIFLCKLTFGQANLMIPICKTIPVIDVDNVYAQKQVLEARDNLIHGLRNVVGIENLIQRQVKEEACKSFANKCFVTIKVLNDLLQTSLKRIQYVDSYQCDFIFLVLYRTWKSHFRFPRGEIVGLYTPDASFAKTLSLIAVSCDLSVVSIEEEKELKSSITEIKVKTIKNRQNQRKNDTKLNKNVFSFRFENQPFNEVAYSYRDVDNEIFQLGIHVVDVEKYVKQGDFLDRYAEKQFFTFLLPVNQRESNAKPFYLFSEALTNEIFSINKEREVAVISIYVFVNKMTLKLVGDQIIDFEQILLDEEFDVNIVDEIIESQSTLYEYLTHIYRTCHSHRINRIRSQCIPSDWFYPDYSLRMNFSSFVIAEEMEVLANNAVSELLSSMSGVSFPVNVEQLVLYETKLHSWENEIKRKCNVKFFPTLTKLCHNRVTETNIRTIVMSRQFLDQSLLNGHLNLFKCDMLFPDVSFHLYRLENIIAWNIVMLNIYTFGSPFTVSITKPLSCFNDLLMQRLLISYQFQRMPNYTDDAISDICTSHNKNKIIFDKYWSICRAYDIRDKFNDVSFILDCVYEDSTEDSVVFHHPFLRNVHHDNFILLECLGLSKVIPPSHNDTYDIELEWHTRIFIYDDNQWDHNLERHSSLTDIYSYITHRLWRPNLNSTDIIPTDERVITELLSLNTYPYGLTSETTKYMDTKITFSYKLRKRQILRIQFNYDYRFGIMQIVPQLLIVNPDLRLCLCHRHDPFKYFMHPNILSEINYSRFGLLNAYKRQFRILNRIEGIHQTINDKSSYFIHDVKVCWIGLNEPEPPGKVYGVVLLDQSWCKERFIKLGHGGLKITDPVDTLKKAIKHKEMEFLICIQSFIVDKNIYWLGHAQLCDVAFVGTKEHKQVHLTLNLKHSSFPMRPDPDQLYSLEIMETPITARVLDRNLRRLEEDTFVEKIVMNRISTEEIIYNIRIDYESEVKRCMAQPCMLNTFQSTAINIAINQEFSLIWGPPGTGKTMVGCIIAFVFALFNRLLFEDKSTVLYCGPSNQSVDVVAEKLMSIFGDNCPKLNRIFSSDTMNVDFPYPGAMVNNELSKTPEPLKGIALHHIIRQPDKPYASKLKSFENYFKANEIRDEVDRGSYSDMVTKYQNKLKKAFLKEIEDGNYEIVLCTTVGSCKKLLANFPIRQVIIDECGMCSEPETLGPILNRPSLKNTVFIGDHKQLRAIITSPAAKGKNLSTSLFERIYNPKKRYCTMLNKQYRMHPSICEFPSKHFYNKELLTARSKSWTGIPDSFIEDESFNGLQYVGLKPQYQAELVKNNVNIANHIWIGKRKKNFECYPFNLNFALNSPVIEKVLFVKVEGEEVNQAVSGSTGNVKSKGNELEVKAVGMLYKQLIDKIKTKASASKSILIITQYRLQEFLIKQSCTEILEKLKIPGPPLVSTVVKSQGSECDYVIFSTVRSLPHRKDIDENPSNGWISKYLGFITDRNQFNVALTRAKKGLFIIGNSHLLSVNQDWKNLIDDLEHRGCVANNIFDCIN